MKKYINPNPNTWSDICARPYQNDLEVLKTAREIMDQVKQDGDRALYNLTRKFDNAEITEWKVSEEELKAAEKNVSEDLKEAIDLAIRNITAFHSSQKEEPTVVETMPGVTCWRKSVAIDKVGLYIPGGSAPLFSTLLMLAIPAQLAGCKELVVCTPAGENGKVASAVLYTAYKLGIKNVFKAGGAQAIAAMTYGTESIPGVYKIFGPGNQYVTAAKQIAQSERVAIDMPAGPSEVLVIADEDANPDYIAADLLSQAEHGPDSQVVCVGPDAVLEKVENSLLNQLEKLPRKEIAGAALNNSLMIAFDDLELAVDFSNMYAPEHLIINTRSADVLASKITNAGSVFIGQYSCESIGDYASGTNHTLPTNYFARSYSGVSVDSFVKKITFQKVSEAGIKAIGPAVEVMADAEQLQAHKEAVSVRLKALNNGDK